MIQHLEPIAGVAFSGFGILAQVALPVPEDLKTWPVTAILGLLLIGCLGIIVYQSYLSNKASTATSHAAIESAKVLQGLTDKHTSNTDAIKDLTVELKKSNEKTSELVTIMQTRPCIAAR